MRNRKSQNDRKAGMTGKPEWPENQEWPEKLELPEWSMRHYFVETMNPASRWGNAEMNSLRK